MLQEVRPEVGWDMTNMVRTYSTSFRLFVLFMLVVFVVAIVKLAKVWWVAPPFRLSRQRSNRTYFKHLESLSRSLSQWMQCSFLAWGMLMSINTYKEFSEIASEKVIGLGLLYLLVLDYSLALKLTLSVVAFLFFARWHVLKRMERLEGFQSESAG